MDLSALASGTLCHRASQVPKNTLNGSLSTYITGITRCEKETKRFIKLFACVLDRSRSLSRLLLSRSSDIYVTSMLIPLPTRVRELESLEGIQREELKWEEERLRCAARITFFKKCKTIHKQLGGSTRKQEVAAQRAHKTLIRRIDTLVIEEQRGRLSLMQNESLRLENILRILEGGIREAVFSADYDLHQRIKYFNKTVEMIIRDESRERKATVGTERYEWLVMCQRFDSGTLRLQRAEVIAKVSAEKVARHDKTREAHQRRARALADLRPADNRSPRNFKNQSTASMEDTPEECDGHSMTRSEKSKRTASNDLSAKMRVSNRHGTEYWDRMLSCAEDQELSKRRAIFIDEDRAWYGLCRFADFIKEREARYTCSGINEIELAKVRARRLQVTQKQEQQERDEIGHLEAVAFQGFQRRLLRMLHENDRFSETEQRRQMGHDQRLAHRYARIALQQIAFVDRERMAITDLLSVTKEETPAVVRHIIPDPVEVSAELSRERRKLFKREEKERNQLVQEENTCFHIIYAEKMSSGGASGRDSKREAARIRREEGEREEQERFLKRLEGTLNKSEIAHRRALCKIEAERLGRAEQQARVRINQDLVDWQGMMVSYYKTAGRMCALLPGVQSEEDRLRGVLLSQEHNLRESYAQAFKVGLRPKTKVPPPPLPSPPADYEQAKRMYAEYKKINQHGRSRRRYQELTPMASASSVNAYPMMSSTMVSSVSSRNGGRLSPRKPQTLSPLSSSSLSLSRSGTKGVVGTCTPHKPPPRKIEGYVGMLNSPSKVAPRAKRYQGTVGSIATAQKQNTYNDETPCATGDTNKEDLDVMSANVNADQKCEVQAPQLVTPRNIEGKEDTAASSVQDDGNHSSYSDDGFDQEAKSSKASSRSSSSHRVDSAEKKSIAKEHSTSTSSRNSRPASSEADRVSADGKQEPDSPRSLSSSRGSATRRSSENISDKQMEDDHTVSRPSSAENKKEKPATPSERHSHSTDNGNSSSNFAARADQQEIGAAKSTAKGLEEEL